MGRGILQRLAVILRHRYRRVFGIASVVLGLSVFFAARLRFDTDILNLLPKDSPQVQVLRRALDDFGSIDLLVIAVRVPSGASLAPYGELTSQMGEGLSALDSLAQVDYQLGEIDELFATFMPNSLLFLDEQGRQEIEQKLAPEVIQQRVKELRRLVTTPQSLALKQLMLKDPLGLAEVFMHRLASTRAGLSIDWASGYFLSSDHEMFLILAEPVEPPQNVDFVKEMMSGVQGVLDGALGRWQEIAGAQSPSPDVVMGGRYVIALGDDSLIRRDVAVNIATSMIGVLALFLFAFRRWGLLLYALVPLACGLILTFGFAGAALGSISAATSGVAALLIGLGIDFVIVSYGRYVEERQSGRDLETALARMSGSCGRAVVIGGITSAGTFYSFLVTDFTGLRQMGVLTGTGILFCMLAVLLLLPAMLARSEDRHRRRSRAVRLYLHGLGSSHLIRASIRRPRPILALGFVITLLAGWLALGIEFEDSVQAMRPEGNPGVAIREEVADRFGLGFEQMMLLAEGESLSEVLDLAAIAEEAGRQLVADGVLTGYDAVTSLIPPVARQQANLAWLATRRSNGDSGAALRKIFAAQIEKEGMRVAPFERGLDLLEDALNRDSLLGLEDFAGSPQTKRILDRYLWTDGEQWRTVSYLTPPPRVWRREAPPEVVEMARSLGSRFQLTGANVVSQFLRQRVFGDAILAAAIGLVVVALLLWLDFRSWSVTVLSLAPLGFGVVWMLGGMVAIGESMNFMNIFVTTMIIGIGVDYGIHMLHRYRELEVADLESLENGLIETGKAIVLAALSTTIGFGSLSLSHYPGLQSMGKVAILGAVGTALVAITVLPAYLSLTRRRADRPSPSG